MNVPTGFVFFFQEIERNILRNNNNWFKIADVIDSKQKYIL
jgi:hypothetical protein